MLAAAVAFALTNRDSEPPRAPPAPDPTRPDAQRAAGAADPDAGEPASLAAAGDRVWALVGTQTRLVSISPATGKARKVADLPRGGEELEVSGDDMYAAFDRPPQVLRLDSRTGERLAASDVFAGPTRRVDVGLGKVWVTERSTDQTQPDHLLRLDPLTLETEMRVPMLERRARRAHGRRLALGGEPRPPGDPCASTRRRARSWAASASATCRRRSRTAGARSGRRATTTP